MCFWGGLFFTKLPKSAKSAKFVKKVPFRELSKKCRIREIFKKSQNLGSRKVATPKNFTQNEGRPRNLGLKVTGFLGSKVKKSDFFLNSGVNQPLIRRVSGHFFDEIWHFFRNLHFLHFWHFLAFFTQLWQNSRNPVFYTFQETGFFRIFGNHDPISLFWQSWHPVFDNMAPGFLKSRRNIFGPGNIFWQPGNFFWDPNTFFNLSQKLFHNISSPWQQVFKTLAKSFETLAKSFLHFQETFFKL